MQKIRFSQFAQHTHQSFHFWISAAPHKPLYFNLLHTFGYQLLHHTLLLMFFYSSFGFIFPDNEKGRLNSIHSRPTGGQCPQVTAVESGRSCPCARSSQVLNIQTVFYPFVKAVHRKLNWSTELLRPKRRV